MHVAKWGNSLAVRLPKALVDELHLAPGDELEVVSASKKEIVVEKRDRRAEFLEAMARVQLARCRRATNSIVKKRTSVERILRHQRPRLRVLWPIQKRGRARSILARRRRRSAPRCSTSSPGRAARSAARLGGIEAALAAHSRLVPRHVRPATTHRHPRRRVRTGARPFARILRRAHPRRRDRSGLRNALQRGFPARPAVWRLTIVNPFL